MTPGHRWRWTGYCPLSHSWERVGVRVYACHATTLTPALSRAAGEGAGQQERHA
jgi:hypothetical protein